MLADRKLQIVLTARDLTGKAFERTQGKIEALSKRVFSLRGAFVAAAGATGMGYFIKRQLEMADAVGKAADKIGVGVETLQEWRHAAELAAGATSQTADMALQRFSRRMAEAAQGTGEALKIVEQYGIQLRDSSGQMRSNMEILEDWAEIVRNAESEQEALRIAFKLFDSEGAAMVNVLRRGRDGMRDLREDARELGIVLSDELVRNAEGANDQVTRLTRVISTQFTRAVAEAAPKIAEVTQALTESDKVREYADSVINVVMAFLQAGAAAAGFFDKIGRGLGIAAARLLGYKDDAAEHLRTQLEESQKELAKYEAVLSGRGGMVDKALGWIPGYITQEEAEEGARLMRQRISLIRQSLADLAGERLDKPSRRDEPPAPLSTPGGGGGGGQDQLKTAWEQAEKWAEEAQATIDRGWVNQSERLEEALAAQASEHERFNDRVTQLHLEAQATIDRGWVNQSERLEEALADPDRFFGPMEQKLGGLQQLTEATAAAMQQNFSSLFLDVMQGKLTSFSDFAKRIFQSIQQAAADYLGQIATNFLFGGKEGSGSGLLGNLFEGIGSLFDGGGGGGSSLPSMQVGFEPFARGGVLRAPTVFPMANGLGLAGEDGPEAVMPLTRTSSGDLGVKATGGERPMNVTLNINAVDAESFERLAARNPQAIVGPLMTALRQGGQTRSQLQEVLR